MPANFVPPSGVEYIRVLPEIILAAVATLIMVLEPLTPAPRKRALGYLALAGFAGALAGAAAAGWRTGPAFSGMLEVDGFATFFRLLV
ncbi:MAG TPA: NADH-quinone oxidoreductase subunit N, partial [Bryobacteraceae bacterium]|nr:NADH-quinone oxidoreductase subunit N [Bryobacteraceae bacterium]